MVTQPLSSQEATSGGFTHVCNITHPDLTETTANTAQLLNIVNPLVIGSTIEAVALELITPFEDTTDAAFNSTAVTVGDNSAATTHLASTELNLNGSEIFHKRSNTAVSYSTAANKLTITFNAMTAKNLAALNKGEVNIYFRLSVPPQLN